MKPFFEFSWEIFKTVLIALLIVIPIRYFLFQPFVVKGESMEPNFASGDYLMIDEISFRFREPERGEVIVFRPPDTPSTRYIKRIIGLPGETISVEDGSVYIENKSQKQRLDEKDYFPDGIYTTGKVKVALGENEYFVLGDNRNFSLDSRRWGVLPEANIIGRVFWRVLPLRNFVRIITPTYEF